MIAEFIMGLQLSTRTHVETIAASQYRVVLEWATLRISEISALLSISGCHHHPKAELTH
jgi:hypothetical protein